MSEKCRLCKSEMLPTKKENLFICETVGCPTVYNRITTQGFRYFLVSESKLRLIDLNEKIEAPSDDYVINVLEKRG